MGRTLKKRQINEYETTIRMDQFIGRNTYGQHSSLMPGEFRELKEVEIYPKYLKSRRGSTRLSGAGILIYPNAKVVNAINWDVGDAEYVISQVGTAFYFQPVLPTAVNASRILDISGSTFALGNDDRADFVINEDRLLVFHSQGNHVIQWNGTYFRVRSMGMKRAYISAITFSVATPGTAFEGKHIYAAEKVYRDATTNGDLLASGPNRLKFSGATSAAKEYARTGYFIDSKPRVDLSWANFVTKITLLASAYTNADATDVGKQVAFTGSGALGKLRQYDNTNRFWWVDITSGTPLIADVATLVPAGGTGVGTVSAVDLNQQDNLWTHIRLYRSKNQMLYQNVDGDIIPSEGTEDEMYEVAMITKAEIQNAAGLTAVATSTDFTLPGGNAKTYAGLVDGVMCISEYNSDDALIYMVDPQVLELLPMPACEFGTFYQERIWASRVSDSTWDNGIRIQDESKNNLYYSPLGIPWYKEQCRTDYFLETGRDGQKVTRLIVFERDLVIMKEDKTMRIADGRIDLGVEDADTNQGVTHPNFAHFVPGFGIMGITSDHKDFKIYGYDHVWRSDLNGINISLSNREATQDLDGDDCSMIYLNGKVMLSKGDGTVYVLHAEQGRGWSEYNYKMTAMNRLVRFAGGTRGLALGQAMYPMEIDIKGVDYDFDQSNLTFPAIVPEWTPFMFQRGDGTSVLEHQDLSIMAQLSADMQAVPYANNDAWPSITTEKSTLFYPSPSLEAYDNLKDREYKLYLEPETIGNFSWCRMMGNFLHYKMTTEAPCIIKIHKLNCIVDEDGNGHGQFDPFQNRISNPGAPGWASFVILLLTFGKDSDTAIDYSGKDNHYLWDDGLGGSRTYDSNLVPQGGQNLTAASGSGYGAVDATKLTPTILGIGQGVGGLCSLSLSFVFVDTCPDVGTADAVLIEDGDGVNWYRAKILSSGMIEFRWASATFDKSFKTAVGIAQLGSAGQYATKTQTMIFALSNNGQDGQWYHGLITGDIEAKSTTVEDN